MHTIYWSEQAEKDYFDNIEYLFEDWTIKEVERFIVKTEDALAIIKNNPKIFQQTDYNGIHRVPIVSQIMLYYKIKPKREIELIRLWNTHQDLGKLKLK
jgi:plasmid stabilization system protein ParE